MNLGIALPAWALLFLLHPAYTEDNGLPPIDHDAKVPMTTALILTIPRDSKVRLAEVAGEQEGVDSIGGCINFAVKRAKKIVKGDDLRVSCSNEKKEDAPSVEIRCESSRETRKSDGKNNNFVITCSRQGTKSKKFVSNEATP